MASMASETFQTISMSFYQTYPFGKMPVVMPVNHAKIFAGVPWVPLDPQNCAFFEL